MIIKPVFITKLVTTLVKITYFLVRIYVAGLLIVTRISNIEAIPHTISDD